MRACVRARVSVSMCVCVLVSVSQSVSQSLNESAMILVSFTCMETKSETGMGGISANL